MAAKKCFAKSTNKSWSERSERVATSASTAYQSLKSSTTKKVVLAPRGLHRLSLFQRYFGDK